MITSIRNAVYEPPVFEKVSEYELPHDVAEWNDEIMKQFFSSMTYIPKEYGVDVVVNNIEPNEGYGKGSVVVFNGDRKINFPIVIKKYMLSPFDVVAYQSGEKMEYAPVSEQLVKSLLSSRITGQVVPNQYGRGMNADPKLKNPGDVMPKKAIDIFDTDPTYVVKMSALASKSDLKKLAVQLEAEPNVLQNFVDNTGDLVANVIDMKDGAVEVSPKDRKQGVIDMNDVVKSQQTVTTIDSQLFDVNSLVPITPPAVCELRCYEYPSMEDFMQSGENASERFKASRIGRPVSGIVVLFTDYYDLKRDSSGSIDSIGSDDSKLTDTEKKRRLRERQHQIFISADGKYYSTFSDYDKTGVGFYGTDLLNVPGLMEKIIAKISTSVTDKFISVNTDNYRDGSDKLFTRIRESYQGKQDRYETTYPSGSDPEKLFCIYGAGAAFACVEFRGNFKKYKVNSSNLYVADNVCIIPARVANVQRVSSVKDDVYKMIIGKCTEIYLVPEASVVINTQKMIKLNESDLMRPSRPLQKIYEEANINKVALYIDQDGGGYRIDGPAFEPLKKIAGLSGAMDLKNTTAALRIMGMTKVAAEEAIKVAINRGSQDGLHAGRVTIYGVRSDYVNPDVYMSIEKQARILTLKAGIAAQLRTDLVKEASALDDPESVDVVLSLNFINQDNLNEYIEQIQPMRKVTTKLASMLLASRMGLSEIDEGAVKKSMDGLSKVIDGLEEVKIAIGK